MKKLALLFAAGALAMSGGILAETEDTQPAPEMKKPEGFVLLQRNIYVPVDAQGKITSDKWVVIEKRGLISTDEFEAAARDANTADEQGGTKDEDAAGQPGAPAQQQEAPTLPEEPTAATPSARSVPSVRSHPPLGEGPMIWS